MSDPNSQIVHLQNVQFAWNKNSEPVIDIPSFSIARGEHVFLKGPSGSGKTTLLGLIAAVLAPQSGTITVDNVSLESLPNRQRDQFRVDRIGLVFQQFNLLPFLSVAENVQLSCRFSAARRARVLESGRSLDEETDRLLSAMKLTPDEYRNRATTQLSVGQQQRVAVARALLGRPPLIIADEPTSSLDAHTRQASLDLLFSELAQTGSSLLFVSHDSSLASAFGRQLELGSLNKVSTDSDLIGNLS